MIWWFMVMVGQTNPKKIKFIICIKLKKKEVNFLVRSETGGAIPFRFQMQLNCPIQPSVRDVLASIKSLEDEKIQISRKTCQVKWNNVSLCRRQVRIQ